MDCLVRPFTQSIREGILGNPARFKGNEDLAAEFVLVGMLWMDRKWMSGEDRASLVDIQHRACKIIMGGLGAI